MATFSLKTIMGIILIGNIPVMTDQQYLTIAGRVAESRVPNCDGLQCPVSSDLNLANWASYLHKYKDTRLLLFLVYGFSLRH